MLRKSRAQPRTACDSLVENRVLSIIQLMAFALNKPIFRTNTILTAIISKGDSHALRDCAISQLLI